MYLATFGADQVFRSRFKTMASVSYQISLLALLVFSSHSYGDWSGVIQQNMAVDSDGNEKKFETQILPQWEGNLLGTMDVTAIAGLKYDTVGKHYPDDAPPESYSDVSAPQSNNEHSVFSIRELYGDFEALNGYWRVGKQQIVWGQADGLKILDVVNPQSYSEFILGEFDQSRIPLWSANVEFEVGDESNLQIIWIPDLTYNELAESQQTFGFTSPIIIPRPPVGVAVNLLTPDKPNESLDNSEWGLKWSGFVNGWDLTANYFNHYLDNPVLYQDLSGSLVTVSPTYERNQLLGLSASNVFDSVTLRIELGFNENTFHISNDLNNRGIANSSEVASVIGLDFQGISDAFISVQWFQSTLLDYEDAILRDENTNTVSFLYRQHFENETWEWETLELHSLDNDDGVLQTKLSHMLESNLEIYVGIDVFYGDQTGLYGQFDENDRMILGVEWGI